MYGIFYISWGYSRARVVLRCQYLNTKITRPRYSGEHNKRQCTDHNRDNRQTFAANGCMCVFSSHLFWTSNSLEVPAWVTQDFSSTFFCGACLYFFREKDSAVAFPPRPWSRIEEKSQLPGFELTSQRVRKVTRLPTELLYRDKKGKKKGKKREK